ncbi:MAG TPA: prolipoprotein diacylglyceryl transferase family protein [Streptosporangiaceae bacterium]
MPAAFLPSPARGVWYAGPVPLRGSALCLVLGVLAALWLASRRYRALGGRPAVILDIATLAVPAGLVGARLYGVLTRYSDYFGQGRDLTGVLRIWDGGLGLPGGLVAGGAAAWWWCRRAGISPRPLAAAVAPALAVGHAIEVWGNWFGQSMYGPPSALPWAVEIAPEHRFTGYESFATFQPVFLYDSAWALVVGGVVSYAIRWLLLSGDRAIALYAGLYAAGAFGAELLLIGDSARPPAARFSEAGAVLVVVAVMVYLYLTRYRKGPDLVQLADAGPAHVGDGAAKAVPAAGE